MRLCAILTILLALAAAGCQHGAPLLPTKKAEPVGAPYHEHALYNLQLGREYMADGRYELAQERLLFALASARDESLKMRLTRELETCRRLIVTQR